MAKGLTVKQEKYVQCLFKGMSQREAYKQAYDAENMKDNTIDRKAYEIANKDYVRARLKELQDKVADKSIVTVEYVLKSLMNVAERCQQAEPVMTRVNGEMVESGEYKFDSSGANKALESLGKTLGMFTDKLDVSADININVDIEDE